VLWVVEKHSLVKHTVNGMLLSPIAVPSAVLSDVPALIDPYLNHFMGENSLLKGD
jgi:hypothetical protein